ncbi:uncharacterized protein LOC136031433 isoform X2 [Artemia franciscana]|uniref:uncharacterized protein LOC136031433 isoform X2 n=1 Tax=Artemia franciscana TaxID=6661 RepID=UPI0032D9FF14
MTRGRRRHRNKTKPVDSKPYHEQLETTLKSTESTLSEKTKGAQKPGASKIQLADPSNKSADACLSDLHDADYDGEKEIEKQLKHFRANDQFSVKQYLIKKTVEDDVPGDKWNGTNAWDAENRRSQSKSGGPLIFRGRGRGRFVSSNGSDRVRGGRGQGIVGARNDRFGYRGNIPTEVTVFGSTMETQCGTLQEKSDEEVKVEDELQLRPTISSFDWEKASREVSLFEDALKNHFFVKKYPTIKGMNKNIFFLSHDVFEKEDEEQKSMFNQHEAEIALNLAKYLTKQDYSQQQITILATCSGQLFYLQKLQKKSFENLSQIRISVVANYLGEKDDIIILSLVRSNKDSNIGFLLSLNRVCAVLSRAKHGLYIIGNMECLKSQSELWNRIYTTLNNMNEIGNQLDLVCQVHDTVTQVTNACDFAAVTNGGCMQKCYAILNCGHLCQRICHFDDRDHLQYQCNKTCDRYICSEKHRCPRKCFEECEKCIIKVEKNLPCGHTATLPCFVDSLDYKCIRLQVYTLDCGHFIKLQCQNRQLLAHFSTFCSIPCNIPCNIPLPCGHQCTRQCHLNDDPEHKKYVCKKKCEKKNKGCKEDHQCRRLCSEDCMKCEVTIKATLPCGHEARIECGADIQKHICTVEVKQVFPKCLHSITKPCYKVQEYVDLSESFEDSKNQVHDTVTQVTNASDFAAVTNRGCMQKCYAILNCGHLCQRICHFDDRDHLQYQCNETCDRYICSEKHRCPRKCFEECEKCIIKVEKTLPCGHTATLPCFVDSLDYKCIRLQVYTLDCGHFIKLQCQNRQLLAHFSTFCSIPCNIPCNIPLPCGHQCTRQCHLNDDPEHKKYVCKKKCEKKNKGCKEDHQCRRLCSEDCMKCEVTIKATLPCGHEARIECGADIQKHICTVEVKQVFPKCLHSITKPCYKVQEYVDLSESFEDSKNQVHDTVTQVTNASDFAAVTNRGCMQKCYAILNCGHLCQRICHFDDRDHLQYQCNETCDRYICSEKHRCPRKCFEECEKCIIKVEKTLPCGHTATLPCFVDSLDYKCIRLQVYTLDCGHFIKLQCQNRQLLAHFSTFCSIPCNIPCNIPLPCGHQCTRQCHLNDDPEHKKYVCKKKCEKKNKGCKGDHQCRRLCSEDCMKCEVTIKATLPCGHEARIECGADIQKHICTVEVKQVFPKCLHSITKPCYKVQEYVDLSESFEDSKNQVHDTVTQVTNASDFAAVTNRGCMQKCYAILNCGHLCQRICHFDDRDHLQYQCNETCDRYICSEKHRCPRKCFEECEKCIIEVETFLPCGHTVTESWCKCDNSQTNTFDSGQTMPESSWFSWLWPRSSAKQTEDTSSVSLLPSKYDLTNAISPNLDRHLIIPLLEFLSHKQIYKEDEVRQAKLNLLNFTNMMDFAMEIFTTLNGEERIPEEMQIKREDLLRKLRDLQEESEPILRVLGDPEVARQIQNSRDPFLLLEDLTEKHGLPRDTPAMLYNFAKFQYECGLYQGSSEYLYYYRFLVSPEDKNYLSSIWGKLASEILMQNFDAALEELIRLKEYIDNLSTFQSPLNALQERTCFIHWSLFVYFNHPKGRDLLVETFLHQPQYLNAIQTTCPHILRYLTTAVIMNKSNRRTVLKDLVRVIQQESYAYKDPITEFIEHLYANFDFDAAQKKLRECREVILHDFFLVALLDDFIENARLMIFETFCRIHECISIKMLAEKLNMSISDAEKWIVNLIRAARLDAKIDSSAKLICVEPCRKKVKCGHYCPNLCGDPCIMPSDCLICNKIKEEKDKSEKETRKRQLETYQEIAQQKALEYRNETTRFKVSGLDPSSSVFVDVRDKVLKYFQPAHSWHPEVTSVQEVFNANLLEAFYLCQTNLFEPSTSREKFHGTNTEACENIITNGFRLPRNDGQQRMFGFGIYFATDSSKSAQQIYTKGSNMLILCDVLLGKEMKVSTPQYTMNYNTIKSLGYYSLFAPRDTKSAGGVLFDEFVIYDPRQAYPRYIINFKATQMGVPLGSILSAKFQKYEIYPSRYFNPSNELDYHFRVAEAQFRRLCQNRDVIKVTYVRNPALESQFLETSKQFAAKYGAGAEEANPILAFHGTPIEKNIESILKNNFQRSYIKRTAYGHGHYFSEFPETALGYAGSVKALILCKILAGRSQDVTGNTLLTNGYDSLRVKKDAFGRGTMIIIDNEKQILPQYVVHIN